MRHSPQQRGSSEVVSRASLRVFLDPGVGQLPSSILFTIFHDKFDFTRANTPNNAAQSNEDRDVLPVQKPRLSLVFKKGFYEEIINIFTLGFQL